MSNPLHPDLMTPAERIAEIGRLLAAGLIRMQAQKSSTLSAAGGDSSFDILAMKSGRDRRKPRNRVGGC
ncbi:MAG: hypothetical protein Q8M31_15960 [Beijerinckiaceae bacterium]|nr:hypothetical protein [Beijerinckiaceae bacterium]